jgi:hypothetical protein
LSKQNPSEGKCLADALLEGNNFYPRVEPSKSLTFAQLQEEQKEWLKQHLPDTIPFAFVLAALEELKRLDQDEEKIAGKIRNEIACGLRPEGPNRWDMPEEFKAKVVDTIALVILLLTGCCSGLGMNLQEVLEKTWVGVKDQ